MGKYSCQWNRVTNDVTADKSSRIVKYRATHSAQIKTNTTKLIRQCLTVQTDNDTTEHA